MDSKISTKIFAYTCKHALHEDALQIHPLHSSVTTLRLLGGLPLTIKSGQFTFNIFSWWTLYCFVTMAIQNFFGIQVFYASFTSKKFFADFDTTITSLMGLVILTSLPHAVLITWRKSGTIAKALNQWKILQGTFQDVTGRPVSSIILEHPQLVVNFASISATFIEFLPISLPMILNIRNNRDYYVFALYAFSIWYIQLVMCTWLMHTHSITQAAKLLTDSFVEVMAQDPSVLRLRLHRLLWLELHKYTCDVTTALGGTVRGWMTTNIIATCLSAYAMCAHFISSGTLHLYILVTLATCGLPIFLVNNSSFLADNQIGRDFIVKLLSFNYQQLSEVQLEEVELFLYTIENSCERFLLEGMVVLSRTTVIDILKTTLTMMVILLQFKVST